MLVISIDALFVKLIVLFQVILDGAQKQVNLSMPSRMPASVEFSIKLVVCLSV